MPVVKKALSAKRAPGGSAATNNFPSKRRLAAAALDSSLGYSLRRAQLSTYDDFSKAMEPFDISPSQFAVLTLIQANPGLTQSAICSALGIQKTNFVALLDKLEDRGITERRRSGGDRRSSALHLTPEGEKFVGSLVAAHQAMEAALARRLGPRRTHDLLALLHEFTTESHTRGL
jgi:DNA-binding MarR family transcriptional regulator